MSNEEESSTRPNEPPPEPAVDPYAILKVDRRASVDDIQRSYKLLSRNFHPDKHAPGPDRDAAQEVFVSFKNAHDILMDPVQRQAYDDLGHVGIAFVKRSLHAMEKDPDALYPTLVKLHQAGHSQQARLVLREALQQADVEQKENAIRFSGTMEFPCTLGMQSNTPELDEAHLSFSVSSNPPTPDHKFCFTVGGTTNVENGKGGASGQVSVGYMPVQGTHVNTEIDISDPVKLSVGTTRTLSNRTLVTASVRTIPNVKHLGLSVVSHRALFDNQVRGTWALGVGTNLKFQYGLLSFTSLNEKLPQVTAKLNLGMSSFPLKLSAKHDVGKGRTAYASCAWGPMGIEVKAICARALSSYASWNMGIRHATSSGLTWLLQLERNDIVFRIPITITPLFTPGYWEKLLLLSFVTYLVDEAIGDMVHGASDLVMTANQEKKSVKRESSLLDSDKSRRDAEQQVRLMVKTAETSRIREEACNGLVIRRATYSVYGGESMNAKTQLQFWVKESRLTLPATPKSLLLGFCNLATPAKVTAEESQSWWDWTQLLWLTSTSRTPAEAIPSTPQLTVRYAFQGSIYEVTVEDCDELILPSDHALCLGQSDVVLV